MNDNIKVLIAEDDFLVSQLIEQIVEQLGYEIVGVASNGKEAVRMCLEKNPDVILMDITMPEMNGLDAAEIIQNQNPTPVIIISSHETLDLIEEASEKGVSAYLTKPPQLNDLSRAVTIALARHKDIVELKRLKIEINEMGLTDTFSGLYNQQGLQLLGEKRFSEIGSHGCIYAISIILRNYQQVVTEQGNRAGDKLISNFCSILKESFRVSDVIARLESNRFLVLLIDKNECPESAYTQRFFEKMKKYNKDKACPCSVESGSVLYDPGKHMTVYDLIKEAEEKLKQAPERNELL